MKKYLFIFFLILAMEAAFGQSKPTQNANVKSAGQKEIDAAMKEAQKAIDELDPETKKMMVSMGIKIPDMKQVKKNVAGISSQGKKSVIAKLVGLEGNWALIENYQITPVQLKKSFPQDFTLSFDLIKITIKKLMKFFSCLLMI